MPVLEWCLCYGGHHSDISLGLHFDSKLLLKEFVNCFIYIIFSESAIAPVSSVWCDLISS